MIKTFNQGEIWLANLNPTKDTELGKTRPVLIFQNQILLDIKHPSTLIIPLTTQLIDDAKPLRMRLLAENKLEKDSDLLIDQIRAIDNHQLVQGPLHQCNKLELQEISKLVSETMGLCIF